MYNYDFVSIICFVCLHLKELYWIKDVIKGVFQQCPNAQEL